VVLLGDPVAHSLSPAIHNAAFRALGLDMVYIAGRVEAADVGDAIRGLRALGAAGANVTVPHKVAAADHVSETTPEAAATGAVNTLYPGTDGWVGANTDVAGFRAALGMEAGALRGEHVVILGAGGAARAATFALVSTLDPASVTIVSRSANAGNALVGRLRPHAPAGILASVGPDDATASIDRATLLVNATPVGLPPNTDESPLPAGTRILQRQVVFDMVYGRGPTRLLREALAAGARTVDGIEMLLGQAAESFRLWTASEMPLDVARQAIGDAGAHVPLSA
jgi:shikimate dehydrogenase